MSEADNARPPGWDNDSLSKYFADAEYNERISALNYHAVFGLLRRVHQAFERAEEFAEKGSPTTTTVPRILLARAHSAFLAAVRLAMSGQAYEGQVVLRSAVEQAWYAFHIFTDPAPFIRAELGLRRHERDQATAISKQEFTIGNVRKSHETVDPEAAKTMDWLYNTLIDFGAHPNQRGVLGAIRRNEDVEKVDYKVGILQPDELRMMMALRLAAAVGVETLRIFQHMYPERFALVGLDGEIRFLERGSNELFRQYASESSA